MRVLIVEDDQRLARLLAVGLRDEGVSADVVTNADQAVAAALATPFDVITLDVMLPGGRDGFEVCSELRRRRVRTPVLMLTARDAVGDRVRGLETGADDYLPKPFAFVELLARIRALARRHLDDRQAVLQAGRLRVDTASRLATVDGAALALTNKEFAVLEYLLHHPRQVISRTQIEEGVWTYDFEGGSNLVDVYVGRIRRKLAAHGAEALIVTVRGAGYRLEPTA